MALLKAAFTIGSLLRSGWFVVVFVGALASIAGGSYWKGHKNATTACSLDKQRSEKQAIARTSEANKRIGSIRVEAERERSVARRDIEQIGENFENLDFLQELLVANDCRLDPDRLRLLNGAILRASGSDR